GVVVAFAVTVAVEHKGGPALRRRRVTGFIKPLAVEPACDLPATAGPDRVVAIVTELQVVRPEQVSTKLYFIVLGSRMVSWRTFFSIGNSLADGWLEPCLQKSGLLGPRIAAASQTRPFLSNIAL